MDNNIDNNTDQELVLATLKDRHSFSNIVKKYEAQLTRYIYRIGAKDSEEVKDILQESFIKVYINLNDYDKDFSFSAWVYRITHNETINHFRKQKNRPQVFKNESDLIIFEMIPDDLNMFDEQNEKFNKKKIIEGLGFINQKYRDVLVLRFFEEKNYEEISDILQIPSGTVATYLNRGKLALKDILLKSNTLDI